MSGSPTEVCIRELELHRTNDAQPSLSMLKQRQLNWNFQFSALCGTRLFVHANSESLA
jgi:hypothetical protein